VEYRRIVIGDVHGHYDGLMLLLEALAPSLKDRVYFLGDLIDRGPKSAQVLDFVQHSPYQTLLGNHEQLMLEALSGRQMDMRAWQFWMYSGGDATVASYKNTGMMPYKHLDWLRSLPTYIDLGDIWLVHAGVHPAMPINEQSSEQLCWIRKEFHTISKPYFPDKLIITGHTITFTFEGVRPGELVRGQGWLDIDTGAYHPKSGWLTGFDLNYRRVYQVNVFNNQVRILPFDEVVRQLRPQIAFPTTQTLPVVQQQG